MPEAAPGERCVERAARYLGFQLLVPGTGTGSRQHLRQGGHKSSQDAQMVLDAVTGLLDLANAAENPSATRVEIADLIRPALAARTGLPDPDTIRRAFGLGLSAAEDPLVEEYVVEWIGRRKNLRPNTRRS